MSRGGEDNEGGKGRLRTQIYSLDSTAAVLSSILKNSTIFGIWGAKEVGPPASSARRVEGLGFVSC